MLEFSKLSSNIELNLLFGRPDRELQQIGTWFNLRRQSEVLKATSACRECVWSARVSTQPNKTRNKKTERDKEEEEWDRDTQRNREREKEKKRNWMKGSWMHSFQCIESRDLVLFCNPTVSSCELDMNNLKATGSGPYDLPNWPNECKLPIKLYPSTPKCETSRIKTYVQIIEHVGKLDRIVRAKEKNARFARVCSTWRELQSCTPHEDTEKTPWASTQLGAASN
jgi:hypothetical protein